MALFTKVHKQKADFKLKDGLAMFRTPLIQQRHLCLAMKVF